MVDLEPKLMEMEFGSASFASGAVTTSLLIGTVFAFSPYWVLQD